MSDSPKLSTHFGFSFQSEKDDKTLFERIREIQDFLIKCWGGKIREYTIQEIPIKKTFFYVFHNVSLNLKGFVGRCNHTGKIVYLVRDPKRISWAFKEGLIEGKKDSDLADILYSSVGVLIAVPTPADFALFVAGGMGYQTRGDYIRTSDRKAF
jgi:hypothetical protein